MSEPIYNPYSDSHFIGFLSFVSPELSKIHFPTSKLLKNYYKADHGYHAIVGKYVIIEEPNKGYLGKIIEVSLPEKERIKLSETEFEKNKFHPTGRIEILTCFDNFTLLSKKGHNELPSVSSKVYLCSDIFLSKLLENFGSKSPDDITIALAHLPNREGNIVHIAPQALFGRHCAVVGSTGGGKSWTLARMMEEVIKNNGKAVVIDATGEYFPFSHDPNVEYYSFNKREKTSRKFIYFDYKRLKETDLFALFKPAGQSQLPKLQEAMKSLRMIERYLTDSNFSEMDKNSLIKYIEKHKEFEYSNILKKFNEFNFKYLGLLKKYTMIYESYCSFNIQALAKQILNECIYETNYNNIKTIKDDIRAIENCQSLLSRILLTINDEHFNRVFNFDNSNKDENEYINILNQFLVSDKKLLILSVSEVVSNNHLREILVNSIGRILLDKALNKDFLKIDGYGKEKSIILFLDEAHLFLNKRIKDEYSIDIELDCFERIAKECRKYGLFLTLSTQMPRDIPRGVFSQIGTFIVHRLINQQDREAIAYACSEASKNALSFLPILSEGEALLAGVDFPMPINIKINKPSIEPNSNTPDVF